MSERARERGPMRRPALGLAAALLVLGAAAAAAAQAPPPAAIVTDPGALTVTIPPNDNGKHLVVAWPVATPEGQITMVARHPAAGLAPDALPPPVTRELRVNDPLGEGWVVAYWGDADQSFSDEVLPETAYVFAAMHVGRVGPEGAETWASGPAVRSAPATPVARFFNWDRWFFLAMIVLTGGAFWLYLGYARRNARDLFIRRIAGVDAIEDAIGRSTEMGRPILYVTGLQDIQNIQTLASILILGNVAEMAATYDTELKVANTYPMTMVIAEEVVRQGHANAGRLDSHRAENIMFITSEQFAFAAAVNGMILRDRPATNIYFGSFFAESLLLAETGYLTGAVQIAGTAEFTQLPFFIAACDYTLIGEELYATSAYLSREPKLLAQLKAGDVVKLVSMILIVVGMLIATTGLGGFALGPWLMP
jgi:hypothetical protein